MSNEKIVAALRSMEFLRDIGVEHLDQLASISRLVDFGPRTTIFHEKEPAKDVYFIIDGTVSLVICAPKVGLP